MEIDGGKDIVHFRSSNVEFGQQFYLAARDARIDMQLSRDVHEILLQHLQGNNTSPRTSVFGYEIAGAPLLHRSRFVVRVK